MPNREKNVPAGSALHYYIAFETNFEIASLKVRNFDTKHF